MRLIKATIASVSKGGYSYATLTQITQSAGVSIGAAQHHFQSKADLILATVEYVFTEMHTFVSTIRPDSGPIDERLDILISEYWKWFSSVEYVTVWEVILGARHDPKLFREICKRVVEGVKRVDTLWKAALSDTALSDDEVRQLVQFAFGTMRGLVISNTVVHYSVTDNRRMLDLLRVTLRSAALGKSIAQAERRDEYVSGRETVDRARAAPTRRKKAEPG
jgi:AcrR family transcriptional regulator